MSFLSPISPTRCNIPLPHLDDSPGMASPYRHSYLSPSPKKQHFLPTLPLDGTVPRISAQTLSNLLSGDYDEYFDNLFIIDCRYNYEYNGGHIRGAANGNSPESIQEMFFDEVIENSVIIFHCEFSHNRGPQMASMFREIDRNLNKDNYPALFYPDVYILDGGYRNFYQQFPNHCDGGYTRMLDDCHRSNGDLLKATSEFRKNVEKMETENRKNLVIPQSLSTNLLQSPNLCGLKERFDQSPMVSKMMNFFTSPIAPRRI